MKKFLLIAVTILVTLFSLSLTVFADGSEISQAASVASSSSGYSPVELAIAICVMFAVISVIGVMFIKTVMKNNNGKLK